MKIKQLKPGDILKYKEVSEGGLIIIIDLKWKYNKRLVYASVFYEGFIDELYIGLEDELVNFNWELK